MKGLVLCSSCGQAPELNSNNMLPPNLVKTLLHWSFALPFDYCMSLHADRIKTAAWKTPAPNCFGLENDFFTSQLLVHTITITVITLASSTHTNHKLRCHGKVPHRLCCCLQECDSLWLSPGCEWSLFVSLYTSVANWNGDVLRKEMTLLM